MTIESELDACEFYCTVIQDIFCLCIILNASLTQTHQSVSSQGTLAS